MVRSMKVSMSGRGTGVRAIYRWLLGSVHRVGGWL